MIKGSKYLRRGEIVRIIIRSKSLKRNRLIIIMTMVIKRNRAKNRRNR